MTHTIRRADAPPHAQGQGMGNQASAWLLEQIAANEMTPDEAFAVAMHMMDTVRRLIALDYARREGAK